MSESKALEVLQEVRKTAGRNYKALIRQAWMDGNYGGVGLAHWAYHLQRIRNTFGPSWLVEARP